MLLGCYRTGDANDPDVYIAATVRVFSAYPLDVVYRVIDPLTGIPSKIKWLPSVSEIVGACEEIHGLNRRLDEYERRSRQQFADRDRIARAETIPADKWKADFAAVGIHLGKQSEEVARRLKEKSDRAQRASHEAITRAWAARGEPASVLPNGSLISPSLIDRVRAWQRDPETIAAEQRWKEHQRETAT